MMMSVVLSVLTGITASAASPSPAPSPSQFPVIIRTVTSEGCTTLHDLIMPVGFVTRKNDEAFAAMSSKLVKLLSNFKASDAPTAADLLKLGGSKDATTGPVDEIDPSGQDDSLLYTPYQVMKASDIDAIANQIYANIVTESAFMQKSYSEYPAGADPKVDRMRQDAQNLIDMQRSLADKWEDFSKNYLNNQNAAWAQDPGAREFYKALLRALVLGQAEALNGNPSNSSGEGYFSDAERARLGSVTDVEQGLVKDERIFAPEEIAAYDTCNNAHIPIPSASP